MNKEVLDSLIGEIEELLPIGPVGLYEFLWTLRSDQPGVHEDEYEAYALAALDRLMATDPTARLIWRLWTDNTYEKPASRADVNALAWADPTEDPYLALVSDTPWLA